MSSNNSAQPAQHFVCTHAQAKEFIESQGEFHIGVCGCREKKGDCSRSRMDVCLVFNPGFPGSGSTRRPASKEEALGLVALADAKGLVTRPFRNLERPDRLDGICFCCPECCYYFLHPEERCDKGSLREATQREQCDDCGLCVESCPFGARRLVEGRLTLDPEKCYGCGLCVDSCPAECIEVK